MKELLEYLKPIIEDENGQPSRKRILEIICILNACILTTVTACMKYEDPSLDVATLTMLIAPLYAAGLGYSGITSYYQNKLNQEEVKEETT